MKEKGRGAKAPSSSKTKKVVVVDRCINLADQHPTTTTTNKPPPAPPPYNFNTNNTRIMMIRTMMNTAFAYMTILFFCSLLLRETNAALRGPQQQYNNNAVQVEDYIVMQMEMKWAMKEMQKFNDHRGQWPTRSAGSSFDESMTTTEPKKQQAVQAAQASTQRTETHQVLELQAQQEQAEQQEQSSEDEEDSDGEDRKDLLLDALMAEQEQQRSIRGSSSSSSSNTSNDTKQEQEEPPLGEIDDEMAMILKAKHAARTVEEYWDTLVAMF